MVVSYTDKSIFIQVLEFSSKFKYIRKEKQSLKNICLKGILKYFSEFGFRKFYWKMNIFPNYISNVCAFQN